MATVNYSWNLPTVGGSEDTWGTSLNANWTDLDTLLGGVSQTEFAILDGATVTTAELNLLDGVTATTAELNLLDGAVQHATAAWEAGTATEPGVPSPADVKAAIDALGGADFSSVAADIIPDADSTRDLGSSGKAWALAYLDAIEPVGADTTIKRVGGTNTTPIVEGIAKAWVNFDGTGTIAARDSLNVSSLTDNGTGDYRITFTNGFSSSNYAAPSAAADSTAGFARIALPFNGGAVTSTYYDIGTDDTGSNSTDAEYVHSSCFGDLA